MKAHKITIRMFNGKKGLSEVRTDWNIIVKSMELKRFYHLYQWYKSYIDSLEKDDHSVYFILFDREGGPIALFPLKRTKRNILGLRCNVLEIPGHSHIELSDLIINKEENINELLDVLIDYLKDNKKNIQWDYIYLPNILEDSIACKDIKVVSRFVARDIVGKCNYLPCSSYDETYNNISKNFRGNLRKARNKLSKNDTVELFSLRKGEELFNGFEEFMDIEASGWKGKNGTETAIKLNPAIKEFYECLMKNYSEIDCCEINLLKVNGKSIAGQFCLLVDNTLYILKIAYIEQYSKLAPGNMLLDKVIKRLSQEKNIKYINLVTDYKWHYDWKPLSYKVIAVYIFNISYAGVISFLLIKLKQCIRPVYRRFFSQLVPVN